MRLFKFTFIALLLWASIASSILAMGVDLWNNDYFSSVSSGNPFPTDPKLTMFERFHPSSLNPNEFVTQNKLRRVQQETNGGEGTNILIFENQSTFNQRAFKQFNRVFHLPFEVVKTFGSNTKLTGITNLDETMLDAEWAHVVAPKARIYILGLQNESYESLTSLIKKISPNVISDSHTQPISNVNNQSSISFFRWVSSHYPYFVSSGDYGNAIYESSLMPDAVIVGGDELSSRNPDLLDDSSYQIRIWPSEGYGTAVFKSLSTKSEYRVYKTHWRSVPDVVWLGGSSVTVRTNQGWAGLDGTSLSTPLWASLWTLMDKEHQIKSTGQILPDNANQTLYDLYEMDPKAFNGHHGMEWGLGFPNVPRIVFDSGNLDVNSKSVSIPFDFTKLFNKRYVEVVMFLWWILPLCFYFISQRRIKNIDYFSLIRRGLVIGVLVVFPCDLIVSCSLFLLKISTVAGGRTICFLSATSTLTGLILLLDWVINLLIKKSNGLGQSKTINVLS